MHVHCILLASLYRVHTIYTHAHIYISVMQHRDAFAMNAFQLRGSLWHFMQKDRPTKAVVLKDKSVVMLYNVDGDVYCSDANSTAFQYPLTHAKIVKGMSCAGIASLLSCTNFRNLS